jgi:hypothetical protein
VNLDTTDLIASLQALPQTDPVEIDGIQFGFGGGAQTCQTACLALTVNVLQTVCVIAASCA